MKNNHAFCVNAHTSVDGSIYYDIVPYHNFRGRTTDTVYSDGCSYTDWGIHTGSYDDCQDYISALEMAWE